MAKLGRQPDLLTSPVALLVDQKEFRRRAGMGGFLVHLCCVHDAGEKAIAATRERMAENSGLPSYP